MDNIRNILENSQERIDDFNIFRFVGDQKPDHLRTKELSIIEGKAGKRASTGWIGKDDDEDQKNRYYPVSGGLGEYWVMSKTVPSDIKLYSFEDVQQHIKAVEQFLIRDDENIPREVMVKIYFKNNLTWLNKLIGG